MAKALQSMEVTQRLTASDTMLDKLVKTHGEKKFWAGVKAVGLDHQDFDTSAKKNTVTVSALVPTEKVPQITEHRAKMWEDLRQSRLRDLDSCLEGMNDNQERRYLACTTGVNPVTENDIPPVAELGGMEEFNERMRRNQEQVKAEQKRKATNLTMDFLVEKKKNDEADAKVKASEKRLADLRKEQAEEQKQKKIASEKKAEKRKQDADRAAAARAEYEDQTEAALWEKMNGAKERRTKRYSPETLAAKLAANKSKRMIAFNQAAEQEEQMLNRLEDQRLALEERLQIRDQDIADKLQKQKEDAQARFQQKQISIFAQQTDWVDNKMEEHQKYTAKFKESRARGNTNRKEISKSTGDLHKKACEKVKQANDRLKASQDEFHAALIERHHQADVRREEINALAFKNENDIHTFREMKHHSFGELTKRRQAENKARMDAHQQEMIFKLAERQASQKAQTVAARNLLDARQESDKTSLAFKNHAREGFIKIAREKDENKVRTKMEALMKDVGFVMPKLPQKEVDGGGEGGH